jgi:hypothetical protein
VQIRGEYQRPYQLELVDPIQLAKFLREAQQLLLVRIGCAV